MVADSLLGLSETGKMRALTLLLVDDIYILKFNYLGTEVPLQN
jgi:hypothetical protein